MIGHIVDTFVLAFGLVPTAAGIRVTVIQTVPRTHTHTHTLIHTHIYTHTYSYSNTYSQHNWTHAPHILLACGLVPTAALFFWWWIRNYGLSDRFSYTYTYSYTYYTYQYTYTSTYSYIFIWEITRAPSFGFARCLTTYHVSLLLALPALLRWAG